MENDKNPDEALAADGKPGDEKRSRWWEDGQESQKHMGRAKKHLDIVTKTYEQEPGTMKQAQGKGRNKRM